MVAEKMGLVRAVWNGPFYIGTLSRPVSVGDVLLKTLETLWRAILSIVVLLIVGGLGIAAWVQIIEPTFFPPLKTQISATATYDDGSAKLPPAIGEKPFRCSPDYPIRVAFKNNSKTTIGHLDFSIEGRPANRSDNVVEGASWRQADTIIPASFTWQSCWAVSVGEGLSPETLDYNINIWGATEADANAQFRPVPSPSSASPEPVASNAPPTPSPSPTEPATQNGLWVGRYVGSFEGGADGDLNLSAMNDGRISVSLSIGAASGCTGDISGTAIPHGQSLTLIKPKDESGHQCRLNVFRRGNRMDLTEDGCGYFHGFECSFSGQARRR